MNKRALWEISAKRGNTKLGIHNNVVVCTEPLRQVGVGRMMTSGSLDGVIVSTLACNARDVGSIHSLDTIFTMFIKPMILAYVFLFLCMYVRIHVCIYIDRLLLSYVLATSESISEQVPTCDSAHSW